MPETCSNCKFYKEIDLRDNVYSGICRRNPPNPVGIAKTTAENWCGEWRLLGGGSFQDALDKEYALVDKLMNPK